MSSAARSLSLSDARARHAYAAGRRAHPRVPLLFDTFAERAAHGNQHGDYYLAVACDEGAPGAWERLQARYRKRLLAFLRRRGARRDEADQVLDEVWGRLAAPPPRGGARTRIGTYDGRGALHAWLCTVAWRRLADAWRCKNGQLSLPPGNEAVTRRSDDPSVRFADDESGRLLGDALEQAWGVLTTRELEAIVLKYRHQLPQNEIARVLRVGAPRVTRLLQSATRRLREAVETRLAPGTHTEGPQGARTALFEAVGRMLARTDAELQGGRWQEEETA